MKEIRFSFIIPHKNCPQLLKRCVDSIPLREDVQVIIVDDNSEAGKRPQIFRSGVEVIQLTNEQSNGAGRARNIGLTHAKGKWLLFSDADDYYTEGFLDILDSQLNEDLDVLYFNARTLGVDGKEKKGGSRINKLIDSYNGKQDTIDLIKYRIHVPWNKVVRRSYVELYGFLFEEVPNGNDSMFTYQVGFFAKNIKIIQDKLYVYTVNPTSISHKRYTREVHISTLCNIRKNKAFYEFVGHKEWGDETSLKVIIIMLLKHFRFIESLELLFTYICNLRLLKESEKKYIELLNHLRVKN